MRVTAYAYPGFFVLTRKFWADFTASVKINFLEKKMSDQKQIRILQAPLGRRTLSLAGVAWALSACGGGGATSGVEKELLPKIWDLRSRREVEEGNLAQFDVYADPKNGPFKFQWIRNGAPIAGATDDFYRFSAKLEDSGANFSVVVSNAYGSVTSDSLGLIVNPRRAGDGIIEEATGALSALTFEQTLVRLGRSGDLFVLQIPTRELVRINPDGQQVPLYSGVQSIQFKQHPKKVSVLERENGDLYVSAGYLEPKGGELYKLSANGLENLLQGDEMFGIVPWGIHHGPAGRILVLDCLTMAIFEITAADRLLQYSKGPDLTGVRLEDNRYLYRGMAVNGAGKILIYVGKYTAFLFSVDGFLKEVTPAGDFLDVEYGERLSVKKHETHSVLSVGDVFYARSSFAYMTDQSFGLYEIGVNNSVRLLSSGMVLRFVDLVDVTPEGKIIFAKMEPDQSMAVYLRRSPRTSRYMLLNVGAMKVT